MSTISIAEGFYPQMPASTYYKSQALGSSLIKLLDPKHPPLDFWWACPWLNKQADIPEEKTEALMFGNAMHMLMLEPDRFHASFNIKECHASSLPNTLGRGQLNEMLLMQKQLQRMPLLSQLVANGKPEVSMFWVHEATGTPCRGRLDFLKDYTIVDLKFVLEVNERSIPKMVTDYGYDVQAAAYLYGLRKVTGSKMANFVFLFQEKKPPYKIMARYLEQDVLAEGMLKYEAAMLRYQECLAKYGTEPWEGYADQVQSLDATQMPRYWSGSGQVV